MADDIGYTLFVEVLKMTQYPGAPFTGNIINDLIMFFFIPMVFIILFTYILLGRIVYGVIWLRALLGIAIFLFMIVNGWFGIFAMLAGPYFIFLIVILGGLYFIPSHFGARPAGMPRGGLQPGGLEGGGGTADEAVRLLIEIKEKREAIKTARKDMNDSRIDPMAKQRLAADVSTNNTQLHETIAKYRVVWNAIKHDPNERSRFELLKRRNGVSGVNV